MAKQGLRLAILFGAALNISCVKIPVEVRVNEVIEITEKEVDDISDKIYEILTQIDFSHPAGSGYTINPETCRDAFKIWLRERFDRGLIEKGLVTPAEYGKNNPDPNFHECRNIELETEYNAANEKYAQDAIQTGTGGLTFDVTEHRDALMENKCSANFIDPKKRKVELTSMSVEVLENTLSIPASSYKIYTSYDVTKEELEVKDAEADLADAGEIMFLGNTRNIPSRYVGELPIDFVNDRRLFRRARRPLVTLDGNIVAIPNVLATVPETLIMAGKTYYIVPKGKVRIRLKMGLAIQASLADAKCVLDTFRDAIRKEEEANP